jgi:peptide deformylase
MAILRIYETPDPMLRQISTPVEKVDDELRALIADMFETMYEAPGIGLAAVQVGVPKRLLVMDLQEPEDPDDPESKPVREPRVFVNPEILSHSDHEVPYLES